MKKGDLIKKINNFSGITADSRQVKKGSIFVAINGNSVDGHNFIDQAVKNGAAVVIGEKQLKIKGAEYLKVDDSREALGEISSAFFGEPTKKLKVIGVTGTKGKTTTCFIIYHILNSLGKKTGLVSSIAARIGNKEIDTGFHVTSPDVVSLHKFLKEMVDAGCEYAVIEVSSHGIDQKRISGIKFDVGVLTNIAPEHIDYHKTFGEYKKIKMGFINSCRYKAISPTETDLDILPGKFNNLNLEVAIKALEFFAISKKEALETIKTFKLPEGRLEEIKNKKGIRIFIDFAHTPESLESALKYLKTQTKGKLIAIFGAAGERDPFKRPLMGKVASEIADEIILTAEDPRTEKAEDIIEEIKKGIVSKEVVVHEEKDRKKAIELGIKLAKKGDLVGIFGKGHEKSMNLDGINELPWSDQKIVRECINR